MFRDITETPVCSASIPASNMGGVIAVLISEAQEKQGLLTFPFCTIIHRTTGNRLFLQTQRCRIRSTHYVNTVSELASTSVLVSFPGSTWYRTGFGWLISSLFLCTIKASVLVVSVQQAFMFAVPWCEEEEFLVLHLLPICIKPSKVKLCPPSPQLSSVGAAPLLQARF